MARAVSTHPIIAMLFCVATAQRAPGQCAWWDGFDAPPVGKGITPGAVFALQVFDSDASGPNLPELYAGGNFTKAGPLTTSNIARWNGTAWSAVGGGIPTTNGYGQVNAMIVWNDGSGPALYVGGQFKLAGAVTVNSIAKWNGTAWSALGAGIHELSTGVPGIVYGLAVHGGKLYVGGYFFGAGSVSPSYLVRWSPGGGWEDPVPDGIDGEVLALAVFNGSLYATGGMHQIGTTATEHIARYDGTTWSGVAAGLVGGGGEALAVWNDGTSTALYAGGDFTSAGGVPASRIARWSGTAWSAVTGGVTSSSGPCHVVSLTPYDDGTGPGLAVGGTFTHANGTVATNIAYYQPGKWSRIGGGLGDRVRALAVYDADAAGPNPGNLFAGGDFSYANVSSGVLVGSSHIARWYDRDSDGDGILDCWETSGKGIDVDHDGSYELNLYADGARVDHKDVFVEVDTMDGVTVDASALTDVVTKFAAVPDAEVNNPDHANGILLHIEQDPLDTGIANFAWNTLDTHGWPVSFDTHKLGHFGKQAQHSQPTVLRAKRLVYRYCIFGLTYGPTNSSGLAEIGGNDFMVTLGGWSTPYGTHDQQAGTFMHELGHTLGLLHGGDQDDGTDRFNYKPNYHSVMNYTWQTPALLLAHPPAPGDEQDYADAWILDYSHTAMNQIDETKPKEAGGIGGTGIHSHRVPVGPPPFTFQSESGDIDWNGDSDFVDEGPARDINRVTIKQPSSLDQLTGFADWSHLKYNFRESSDFGDGVHQSLPSNEMTQEVLFLLARRPGGCNVDFDRDLDNDADDIVIFAACATRAGVPYDPNNLPAGCTLAPDGQNRILADVDRDGDVDQDDFGVVQRCLTGPGV